MSTRIYLDHASAWPVRPEARQAFADALDVAWADPSRRHREGRAARDLLDRATTSTATTLGVDDDALIWTGSGTEAVHLAVLGTARASVRRGDGRRHVVVSAVEHSAVLAACDRLRDEHGFEVDVVGVDRSGTVDPDAVRSVLRSDTLAVHLQHANHEVGAIQPTHEAGLACREVGALLHVDACQSVGQLGVTLAQLGADLLSASGAKFGGLRGTGLLALGERARIAPLLVGDDRQRKRRAGLEDVATIAGTAVALQAAVAAMETERSRRELVRRHLRARLPEVVDGVEVHGPLADAHPGIVAFSPAYLDGDAVVAALDERGFACHAGSSCASQPGARSHVLDAMGALTQGHVRIGVGPETTVADADDLLAALAEVVADLRAATGRGAAPARR